MTPAVGAPATTSYAKAMQSEQLQAKVDNAAAPLMKSREEIMSQLRKEGAVGVVVAVRGEIVWADLFRHRSAGALLDQAGSVLCGREPVAGRDPSESNRGRCTRFLETPKGGTETSEGSVGIYRYRELKSTGTETFMLESLLPDAKGDVHVSKLKLRNADLRPHPVGLRHPLEFQPMRPPQ